MARKKSRAKPATKNFNNSPFMDLKGLSALASRESSDQDQDTTPVFERRACAAEQDPAVSFAEEMDLLGVTPLGEEPVVDVTSKKPTAPPVSSAKATDEAVFLQAVGTMETVFKDALVAEDEVKQANPRRMRQLAKGHVKPQAQLDLHGHTAEEARTRVMHFLQNAVVQGHQVVLVITGKGLHSAEGPVLKQAVEQLLRRPQSFVLEWGVAPKQYGGSGAYVVFLRNSSVL